MNLLRLCELWVKTRDDTAERRLREAGVVLPGPGIKN